MRCVAGAGLLALVGCNQVFGIASTRSFDAAADVVPDMPHVVLDWQIATVLPSGAPDPIIQFAPIDPSPGVRIAALDAPFEAAVYAADDGSIAIPRSYLNTTWRLEYTLSGGVPHEVQWAPDDKVGHLTVPMFGRLQRDPVASGTGYAIAPTPAPSLTFPRVFTTGLWTEGDASPGPATGEVDYKFDRAVSLSGARGRPDPGQGDRALLVSFITKPVSDPTFPNCRIATGSAALDPELQPLPHTPQTPTWDMGLKPVMSEPVSSLFIARLTSGLGKLESKFGAVSSKQLFGATASIGLPGLAAAPDSLPLLGMLMPLPVMATLVQCPYNQGALPDTAQPQMLDSFPHVLHVQLVDTRDVLGVTLASGMETVVTAASASSAFPMAFPAPLATQITLATPTLGTVDLAGDVDQVAVGAPGGGFTLGFVPEAGPDLRGDYYDVVLHRISGSGFTTERIYTVTAPRVQIDGAVLAPGADYVFEIRSFKGHPRARLGDFSAVDYPYGSAIVFTRTFKTS